MKKLKKYIILITLILLILIIRSFFIQRSANSPKLLLLGIDAATWDTIDPLIADGKMPNLEYLIKNGVRATPTTLNPTISPAIWTTVATGVSPQKHGITNFISTSESSYNDELMSSDDRRVKALWNIFSESGLKVGLFSYWATWPSEKINGYNVTERALFDGNDGIHPLSLKKWLFLNTIKVLGFSGLGHDYDIEFPEALNANDKEFFKVAHDQINLLNQLFLGNSIFAFKKERPDIVMQISGAVDAAQHLFLKFKYADKYTGESIDPDLVKEYGSFIDDLYIEQDKMLGKYLNYVGTDTHVIVMSDHGVFLDTTSGTKVAKFNEVLNKLNYLEFDESGNIDYSKTLAFECNNNTFDWQRRLCINLKGKYDNGIVEQFDYQKIRAGLLNDLKSIVDKQGNSLFHSIELSSKDEADIEYDIDRSFINKKILVKGEEIEFKQFTILSLESGRHYANPLGPDGIFIWSGPGIKKGVTLKSLDYIDIAPSILAAMGFDIPNDMDGDYMSELFLEQINPKYIESYEQNPNYIYNGNHESLEESDNYEIHGQELYIHSSITENDSYDQFCYELIDQNMGIKINLIEHSVNDSLKFSLWDNELITDSVDFIRDVSIDSLFTYNTLTYDLLKLRIYEQFPKSYMFQTQYGKNQLPELALWANIGFDIPASNAGTLILTARGVPAGDVFPIFKVFIDNKEYSSLIIDSENYNNYFIDIPASNNIRFEYINDEQVNGQDRNVFLQKIKFLPKTEKMLNGKGEIILFNESNNVCIKNMKKGSTEINLKFYKKIISDNINTEVEQQIIDLLEITGDISLVK